MAETNSWLEEIDFLTESDDCLEVTDDWLAVRDDCIAEEDAELSFEDNNFLALDSPWSTFVDKLFSFSPGTIVNI